VSADGIQVEALLEQVDQRLAELLRKSDPPLNSYLEEAGKNRGKMLRPRLMIITSSFFGRPDARAVVNCAACCELLHLATLIHDDIIDEAGLRRGHQTLNNRFGNEIAVIVGDYALAIVFRSLLAERDFRIMDMVLSTSQQLGMGELQEILNRNNQQMTVEQYFSVIALKTAALFNLCGGLGAYLGGAGPREVELAGRYGQQLGTAFQIVDDLLDIMAEEARTGKPSFNDLAEGRMTLPLIHALQRDDRRAGQLILDVQRSSSRSARQAILAHLEECGSLEFTIGAAADQLRQARLTAQQLIELAKHDSLASELQEIEGRVMNSVPSREIEQIRR
jgi:octaprenyl-diphosphate synthase